MVNALDVELQKFNILLSLSDSETYSTHSSFGSVARISPKDCPAPPLREVPRNLHGAWEGVATTMSCSQGN